MFATMTPKWCTEMSSSVLMPESIALQGRRRRVYRRAPSRTDASRHRAVGCHPESERERTGPTLESCDIHLTTAVEGRHWWYRERRAIIARELRRLGPPGRAIEIGAAG